jgi:hypothetical protein
VTSSHGWAFGLDVESAFEIEGLGEADPRAAPGRRVTVELGSAGEVAAAPGAANATRIAEAPGPDGRPAATFDSLPGGGFVARADEFGVAWVSAGGDEVVCAPPDLPAWRWQRFLTGQVLPFAAVLQGLEVFHAAAVVVDGRAIAVLAGSGVGKTSLGLNLALRGLPFLNDDVLVLERDELGGVVAHPGAGVANVRRDGSGLAERVRDAGLGGPLGSTEHETRVTVRRHERSVPLGVVFHVQRTGSGDGATIAPLSPVDPRVLLGGTFNLALRDPERLERQLDVCGRIADSCRIFSVDCPPAVDAAALAEDLHRAALAVETL